MRLKYIVLLALPTAIFASDITMTHSDFFHRVFNFSIFAGLMYYLLSNPIKSFFVDRKSGIENQLVAIEKTLQDTKKDKEEALLKLEESKTKALEIIETAHKEAKLISQKIAQDNIEEIKILDKSFVEKCENESRRMNRELIDDVLNSSITNNDIILETRKVVELVSKKVA